MCCSTVIVDFVLTINSLIFIIHTGLQLLFVRTWIHCKFTLSVLDCVDLTCVVSKAFQNTCAVRFSTWIAANHAYFSEGRGEKFLANRETEGDTMSLAENLKFHLGVKRWGHLSHICLKILAILAVVWDWRPTLLVSRFSSRIRILWIVKNHEF